MKAIDILYQAKQNGVEILLNGDQLQLFLPENDNIDNNLIQLIKDNKQALIDFLKENTGKVKNLQNNFHRIKPIDREVIQRIPLSFSQERLWFIDQLEGSLQYHTPEVFRLKGRVNKVALSGALKTLVDRHQTLRTVVREQDGMTFQILKEADNWQLITVDGSRYFKDNLGLQQYIDALINQPFNLSQDYMIRAHLISLTEIDHLLVIIMHHIASDGWSKAIFVNELSNLYESYLQDRPVQLQPLQLQYADYAIWQRDYLQGSILDEKIRYWEKKLDGLAPLQLPTDFPRPVVQTAKGTSIKFNLDRILSQKLLDLSQEYDATLFMALLAAFKTLLYRYTGQSDISVGTSIADRPQEVENLIGFFVNTLALRTQVDGEDTFTDLLQKVKATTLEAYSNGEVPFEKVVEAAAKDRQTNRSPLFQVMLVLSDVRNMPELHLKDLQVSPEEIPHNASKFDFTFFITQTANGLEGVLAYSTELYTEQTVNRLINHFKTLLSSIVMHPHDKVGKLTMLTTEEEKQLIETFNNNTVGYPKDKSVVGLFEEQVTTTPGNVAVVFEEHQLTYQELNAKANQLAHFLKSLSSTEETLIPICIDPGLEMMVGLLGIMKANAAYVPIDPEYPQERTRHILGDTRATIVLTTSKHKSKFYNEHGIHVIELDTENRLTEQPITNTPAVPADHLAYVIYTSGSTGTPKGVMIEHRNLIDYVFGLKFHIPINECLSFALVSSISTDLGNTVLYSSILTGGTLHLFSKEAVTDSGILVDYFKAKQVDCLKIVPSHWKALSTEQMLFPAKLLIFGGEALQADVPERIRLSGSECKVVNHYGPTETTIGKLLHEVNGDLVYNNTIPIGKPFSNTEVYISSKDFALCPIGVPGELLIGGDGVARGYLNNIELTNVKFISNPFKNSKESRLYRTGDLVRYLPDGNIEFIGRIDEQVKIRGFRIELGEIETVLNQSGLLDQSVVLAREISNGNKQLVAYILTDEPFNDETIVTYLRDKLPDYMVPSIWIKLESFPLLPNGKINRRALAELDILESSADQFVAPRTDLERNLVDIWQELLEVERVSITDDFFKLGGHSLLAIQLISVIRKRLNIEVTIGDIFDYPSIESLAAQFDKQADLSATHITKTEHKPAYIPLSFSQERLWFIDQLEGSIQYHRPEVLTLKGHVNKDALSSALKTIVNRHEVLRTVIRLHEGKPYQFMKEKDHWSLAVIDGSLYRSDPSGLDELINKIVREPFDLSKDHTLRAHLISLNADEHLLVITLHHIVSDGRSISILINELSELYQSYIQGRDSELPSLEIQYSDYALWQRNNLQKGLLDQKISYWRERLNGLAPLQLTTDYPRPAVSSNRGSLAQFAIEKELGEQLQALCQQEGVTLFMMLLAAYNVLLYRYSGQEDICVGSAATGRQQEEIENLIGFFVNTLPLRIKVQPDESFVNLLQQVKTITLDAYENAEVPFEKIVETVVKERDMSRAPLFQVMFDLGTANSISKARLADIEIIPRPYQHRTAKFDFTFSMVQSASGLAGFIEYSTDLFNEATINKMILHFKELLLSIVRKPYQKVSQLNLLTAKERLQLLKEFNNTTLPFSSDKTIIDLFEEQVTKTPGNVAVVFDDKELTYEDLNWHANQLAHYLRKHGVTQETLVPICINRSAEMMVGILGILKAGAAYVPIDPVYPAERINYILSDTNASFVVTHSEVRSNFIKDGKRDFIELDTDWHSINGYPTSNPDIEIHGNKLAYVIYTSGSTGKPKGVMIEHCSLTNYLLNSKTNYINPRSGSSGTFMHLSYTFDASITGIFMPLVNGKSIVIASTDGIDMFDEKNLKGYAPYDFIKATPSHLELLHPKIKLNGQLLTNRLVIGGEALFLSHFSQLIEEGIDIEVVNEYGPTEATVGCSTYTFSTLGDHDKIKNKILIGKPIDNIQLYVLDSNLELVPIGVPGEICIGGIGLARGYLNQPGLTAEKFIQNPFAEKSEKIYRTGDLGRWLADGNLEYLGRKDDQVKIRGYRIELGEVENVLLELVSVQAAVVLAKEDTFGLPAASVGKAGNKHLVAYIVPNGSFNKEEIVANLKSKLPEYMIPTRWVQLESLPLTTNGKIDKQALLEYDAFEGTKGQYEGPRNEIEKSLVEIWKDILEVDKVGIHDDLFDLGGHSLLVIRLISIIRKELEVELTINDLFQFTTISELSKYIELQKGSNFPEKDVTEFDLLNI